MKIIAKDLEKAMIQILKDGAVVIEVRIELIDGIERVCLKYQDAEQDDTIITIARAESGGFNHITTKKRF